MPVPTTNEVTELLQKWSAGDADALEELTPVIYSELHRIAKRYMNRERDGHTLQTTALVNEAYMRLIDWKTARWENRAHFFGVSAQLMRRILVDFARKRPKISGEENARHIPLEEAFTVTAKKR
jgi:RNA polymerase sigma-70 factor, ECF subfamily